MMKRLRMFTANAFAYPGSEGPTGNPAALCLVPRPTRVPATSSHRHDEANWGLQDEIMQQIATRLGYSETTFVLPEEDPTGSQGDSSFELCKKFHIRWFTPTNEVNLCGHATLASAALLFTECNNKNDEIEFISQSGSLFVHHIKEDSITREPNNLCHVSMHFPRNPVEPVTQVSVIQDILGKTVQELPVHSVHYSQATRKLIIRLDELKVTPIQLAAITPDTEALLAIDQSDLEYAIRGVSVTLLNTADSDMIHTNNDPMPECALLKLPAILSTADFFSRYFSPWNGIPEDPVNGSSHTNLGPYWHQQLSKTELTGMQLSRRGGILKIHIPAEEPIKIVLSGAVETTSRDFVTIE